MKKAENKSQNRTQDKVLLIDGMNFIHRANISFGRTMIHSRCNQSHDGYGDHPEDQIHCLCGSPWNQVEHFCYGEKYSTVFNFFRNLRPIIEQFQPDKCFFVLEGHAQFRYDMFPEYKANRKIIKTGSKQEEKDKFFVQAEIIVQLLKHLPITVVRAANYECDDLISTLAQSMSAEDITIISADTDFIQLLQLKLDNIKVYNPISKKFYQDPGYFYIGWKALCGDSSDNIPGFEGIGDKKAQKIISNPEKFAEFLSTEEKRATFSMYRSLIEFRDVPDDEVEVAEGKTDWEALQIEFETMQFQSLLKTKTWEKYRNTFSCIKY